MNSADFRAMIEDARIEHGGPLDKWSGTDFELNDGYDPCMARYMASVLNAAPMLADLVEAVEAVQDGIRRKAACSAASVNIGPMFAALARLKEAK